LRGDDEVAHKDLVWKGRSRATISIQKVKENEKLVKSMKITQRLIRYLMVKENN
jgi:hypothetical protein